MKKVSFEKLKSDGKKKFKTKTPKNKKYPVYGERDVEIEILGNESDADFEVETLETENVDLPTNMPNNGPEIVWLTNFAIKKKATGAYINQKYNVKITGLSGLKAQGKNIVIFDGNASNQPYILGDLIGIDTIELTDGDPAVGSSPP
jgi:hypothetical protein